MSINLLSGAAVVSEMERMQMINREQLKQEIRELITSQKLAVLSTVSAEEFPYASLIAFAVSHDLQEIVLATSKATRKFANIKYNPRVSLLVDNRSNKEQDFHDAKAVTVMGFAEEIAHGDTQSQLVSVYLKKHPYLDGFLNSPTTAFIKISVLRYYIVSRFQEVMELHIRNENDLSLI